MVIFLNNKSTKFSQITFRIKRFTHKRKVVPFFCLTMLVLRCSSMADQTPASARPTSDVTKISNFIDQHQDCHRQDPMKTTLRATCRHR